MRNPRRAYEKDGTEIAPMDLRSMMEHGVRTVAAECLACQHASEVDVSTFPPRMAVPDVALRLKCSRCSSKRIATRPSWSGFNPTGLGRHGRTKAT